MMHTNRCPAAGAGVRGKWSTFIVMWLAIVFAAHALAQAPAAPAGAAPPMSSEELANLVGPIALYPDDLVAIILPASTSPIQIVQADRFLEKRKADPKLPVDDKWDDPVKSLLNYPDVVKKMSTDLDWTTALGEAVVADQGAVIEAVQVFRRKAQSAGSLKSDDKQVVKAEKEIIYIESADPQVIYVPQYNPTTVVVQSAPPVYYPTPYPSYYYPYPPGAALATGVIWGAAIGAAWSGNHYGCCGDANINVNRNTNINTGDINRGGGRQQAGGGSAWKSNKQPGQVSNSVGRSASGARAGDARAGTGAAGAGRASAQTTGAARSGAGGGDAFGGYGSGRQAQMDSSRGASSRGSASAASARPTSSASGARSAPTGGGARSAPSGGGARAGGGGGGRGGGGGGRGGGGGGRGGGRR